MKDFPGNSNTARIEQENPSEPAKSDVTSEPKQVKKVVSGKVTEHKKSLGKRFRDMFIHDGTNFAEHIVEKVVVPMVKEMALSIVTQMVNGVRQGVEEAIFGPDGQDRRKRTTSYGNDRPRINYTSYSSPSTARRSTDRDELAIRRSNRVREILVETREDGDAVLEELDAIIDSIGHCTVGDFYAACGESTTSTDETWGWTTLREARVRKITNDEFLIAMPRPRSIES